MLGTAIVLSEAAPQTVQASTQTHAARENVFKMRMKLLLGKSPHGPWMRIKAESESPACTSDATPCRNQRSHAVCGKKPACWRDLRVRLKAVQEQNLFCPTFENALNNCLLFSSPTMSPPGLEFSKTGFQVGVSQNFGGPDYDEEYSSLGSILGSPI